MKKELIIYTGLFLISCALFSFEFMVKSSNHTLGVTSYEASGISSISFDVPANVYFIQGYEHKIILEGTSSLLNSVSLDKRFGDFVLKRVKPSMLQKGLQKFLFNNQELNMYVIAENIELINVINQNGCLVKNALYNDDRALLEVEDSDIIQFARTQQKGSYFYHTNVKIEYKALSLTSCL